MKRLLSIIMLLFVLMFSVFADEGETAVSEEPAAEGYVEVEEILVLSVITAPSAVQPENVLDSKPV